jgi:dihydrolipoamide dehydrogenase
MSQHDIVVIGGGPGGYVAALRAAQLGLKVACVDARPRLGGTCLNVGCIPSKALLDSTQRLHKARHELERHGIRVEGLSCDLVAMMARKDEAVETLTGGIDQLFQKHSIEHVRGRARLLGPGKVEVEPEEGDTRRLRGDHVILATGSTPAELPELPIDGKRVLSSTGALELEAVPEHLVVIGAGYIGLELGSVWSRLGARTTCVEVTQRVLPGMDGELAAALQDLLGQQGLDFRLGTRVTELDTQEERISLRLAPAEGEENTAEELECSHVLVAVGRRPRTDGLGLEDVAVETDERGFVRIDEGFRTTLEGVYAIGDVAREPMLAHKAQDEALACVETIAGRGPGRVNYEAIASVVYTWPELASVGRSEDELRDQEVEFRKGRASFRHNSRARCTSETEGFVKILADAKSDRILGAHVLGPQAGTLIHEIVTSMEFGACAEELGRTCHAHPTLNEAVREAALALHERAIHR